MFTETSGGWDQTSELTGIDSASPDEFGYSVGLSGDDDRRWRPENASYAGRAYVFTKISAGWDEAELKGTDTVTGDFFGDSVSISGSDIIVGAPGHAAGGRVYVFSGAAERWRQTGELRGAPVPARRTTSARKSQSRAVQLLSAMTTHTSSTKLTRTSSPTGRRVKGPAGEIRGSAATGADGGLGGSSLFQGARWSSAPPT